MIIMVKNRSPPVASIRALASISITPVSAKPPTTTNSPAKKPIVDHSTSSNTSSTSARLKISIMAAAARATTLGSMCTAPCKTNATAVTTVMTTLFVKSDLLLMAS